MANYFTWSLTQNLRNALPRSFEKVYFKYMQALTGVKTEKPRWEQCIEESETYMGMALGAFFIKQKQQLSFKNEVGIIILVLLFFYL